MKEIVNDVKIKMDKSLQVLKKDLSTIRAGRANPHLLDKISIDYYGTMTPINQMGNIAVPEPRLLTISLWESKFIAAVEKAIMKSDLGITPSNDGRVIRLVFPELTEERRKDIVKAIHKLAEEAKVTIRSVRRDFNENLKKMKKANQITEDDLIDGENEVQKVTDEFIKKVDEIIKLKEKEIMDV
jgi:ribosome recycling factor